MWYQATVDCASYFSFKREADGFLRLSHIRIVRTGTKQAALVDALELAQAMGPPLTDSEVQDLEMFLTITVNSGGLDDARVPAALKARTIILRRNPWKESSQLDRWQAEITVDQMTIQPH